MQKFFKRRRGQAGEPTDTPQWKRKACYSWNFYCVYFKEVKWGNVVSSTPATHVGTVTTRHGCAGGQKTVEK